MKGRNNMNTNVDLDNFRHKFEKIATLLSIAYTKMIDPEEDCQLYYLIGATMNIAYEQMSKSGKLIASSKEQE